MAKVQVICPNCKKPQSLPTRRLHQPWVCLLCGKTIEDPYMNRRVADVPKLAIPLQGKIISSTGVTNLSDIVADSQSYSGGFSDLPWDPTKIHVGDYSDEWDLRRDRERRLMRILIVLMIILILGGAAALTWYIILPML